MKRVLYHVDRLTGQAGRRPGIQARNGNAPFGAESGASFLDISGAETGHTDL